MKRKLLTLLLCVVMLSAYAAPMAVSATVEFSSKCVAALDDFLVAVDALPEADALKAFEEAVDDYETAHMITPTDLEIPQEVVDEYESAYETFAKIMGIDTEPEYPAETINAELEELVWDALSLYYDAMDAYEGSNFDKAVEKSDLYKDAKKKLDTIIEIKPEFDGTAGGASTFGVNPLAAHTVQQVETVPENIEIHLFDYGPDINTLVDGVPSNFKNLANGGYLPFIHSEYTYGWALDVAGTENNHKLPSGNPTAMNKTLVNGYPSILSCTDDDVKAGSLQYLFSKTGLQVGDKEVYTEKDIYEKNLYSANPYRYQTVHYAINENGADGGTGLFRKENGYFVYDSAKNAAYFNKETGKFEVYDYVLRPAYTVYNTGTSAGNFLPFNQGHVIGREDYQTATEEKYYVASSEGTYTNPADNKKYKYKSGKVCISDTLATQPASVANGTYPAAYRLYSRSQADEVNLWFGLNVEFDFYMTKDGKVEITDSSGNKVSQDMIFDFLGDDDVWVYIDDVLVLDISGTHGALDGTINFATGAVDYTNANQAKKNESGTTVYERVKTDLKTLFSAAGEYRASEFNGNTFKEYTRHTLKFYYLERGGNISYCKLKFNLDPLPKGGLTVEKQVDGVNEALQNKDEEYTFKFNGKTAQNEALTNKEYKVYNRTDAATVVRTGKVSDGGTFKLKDDEYAVFTDLSVTDVVSVKETSEGNYTTTCTVNGTTKTTGDLISSGDLTISDSMSHNVVFTNTINTGELHLKKTVDGTDPSASGTDAEYDFNLSFGGTPYEGEVTIAGETVDVTDGLITLKKDQIATVSQIPNGMEYTLTEDKPAHYDKCNQIASTYKLNDMNAVDWPFDGDRTAEKKDTIETNQTDTVIVNNTWRADLTIKKSGIDGLDDHKKVELGGKTILHEEKQSTVYTVTGPNGFNTDVVIWGNGEVKIKDLQLGTYTVTEKTNWSWRYELEGTNDKSNDLKKTGTTECVFENIREKTLWLSGDNFTKNLFTVDM